MKDINKTPQTKGVDAPAENSLRSRLTSMVSRVVGSVRSAVKSVLTREKSTELQSGTLVAVPRATKKPLLITLQDIDTSVVPAQATLEALYEFVNENGWGEGVIPILELGITKIISDTETTIAEFEEDIALYFQKFWYKGDNFFESINDYSGLSTFPLHKAKIINESLNNILSIRESLRFNRTNCLPFIINEVKRRIQNAIPSKEKDVALMKKIREALVAFANDRVSLEQSQKEFATQTSTERWFGNIQS